MMKRFLGLILAAALLLGAALAEAPDAIKLYREEPMTIPNYGIIIVLDSEFADAVQADSAAGDSAKLRARDGCVLLVAKLMYRPLNNEQRAAEAFFCLLYEDPGYGAPRLMMESRENELNWKRTYHSVQYGNPGNNRYLIDVQDSDMVMRSVHDTDSTQLCYYRYDYIQEVPAELAETDDPLYLLLNVNGTGFYYLLNEKSPWNFD